MSPRVGDTSRAGVTSGDVLIGLAVLCLVGAALYPRLRWAAFQEEVDEAVAHVDQVVSAARAHRAETGAWPATQPPGTVPPELARRLPEGFSFAREDLTLAWDRWSRVERPRQAVSDPEADTLPPAPPVFHEAASVTLSSPDNGLLAALLDHYGARRSFAREGRWTLMVAPPDDGGP